MKKKIEDMTIKEIMDFCNKQKDCSKCPLDTEGICKEEEFCPAAWHYLKEEFETIELGMPNKRYESERNPNMAHKKEGK